MENIEHAAERQPKNEPSKNADPEKARNTYEFRGGILTNEIGKYEDDMGSDHQDDEI